MKKHLISSLLTSSLVLAGVLGSAQVSAADYIIDTEYAHASINFKIKHLGYSWLTGRFNQLQGSFNYDDKDISSSSINVSIAPASIDTNHAEREKHLKSKKYLNTDEFSKVTFVSTKITDKGNNKLSLQGDLTLHGVKKNITIDALKIGEGKDPWGGYRVGFTGTTTLKLADFGYTFDLGPASKEVELTLNIEGVRQ
ncbi:Protein yceI precursor [hydrothermal vent metagenome]|uniref:Protein yceI n=1 Tax=hydrothermal vent metagenome TaxID=652676 RepID=A0A3B0XVP0_9ZZZZ